METAPPPEPASRLRGIAAVLVMTVVGFGLPYAVWSVRASWSPMDIFPHVWGIAAGVAMILAFEVGVAVLLLWWLRPDGEWRLDIRRWFRGGAAGGLAFGLSMSTPIPLAMLVVGGTGAFSLPEGGGIPWETTTVALVPLSEELLFRGFFFGVLRREVRLHPWAALVASSLLFGAFHLPGRGGLSLVGVSAVLLHGCAGALLCWAFWRRGEDLWFPIGLHAGVNLWYALRSWGSDHVELGLTLGVSKISALALAYFVLRVMEERRKAEGEAERAAPG